MILVGKPTSLVKSLLMKIISLLIKQVNKHYKLKFVLVKINPDHPSPPSKVMVMNSYQRGNFSITLSWESGEDEVVDEYRIHTNTTPQYLTTTSRSVALEAKYNIPLEIRVSAINCAGSSPEVTQEVFVGELSSLVKLYANFLSPSAGCGSPSPPVNGSVGEFTSSRVGDQVVYSCDTHLVLVGETTATCSYPSLQWLPPSDDVLCVQPSGIYIIIILQST